MNILIKICIVDISSIIITGSEYNSIHEIKTQSKFFFDLNLKEIDLSNRNNLINEGKKEELSDNDINLDDEYLEELESNKFEQHIEMSECQKDEKEYVYEYNDDKKDISKLSIEKMITKKLEKNNEIEYIETNANEIIFNEKINKEKDNDKNIENNKEEKDKLKEYNIDKISQEEDNIITNTYKGYEIKDNCLIISMAEMTLETLEDLKKIIFCNTIKR